MPSIHHKIEPAVGDIIASLKDQGHEAYIVGGAVRDLMLDIQPKDYDIATSAPPEEVRRVFGRRKARIIGRRFRLVHVTVGHHVFEVSTYRREPTAEERSTRLTDDGVMLWDDNQYGTREQDAVRRDFTVNALYYDPAGQGQIIDLVNGVADMQNRVVRTIGEPRVRLAEDPVRMLRALKLVAQYGFHLEPALDAALRELAPRIGLSSKARCFEELLKILAKPHAWRTFDVCREYGLLAPFWPTLDACLRSPQAAELEALLRERDRRVGTGRYAKSKTLGLSTLAFPFVDAQMRGSAVAESQLWTAGEQSEHLCREFFLAFYQPFAVPRFLTARSQDVLRLLPVFLQPPGDHHRGVVANHEYKYALELFQMVAARRGWSQAAAAAWPPPDASRGEPREGQRPRRRRRRFPRRPPPAGSRPAPESGKDHNG